MYNLEINNEKWIDTKDFPHEIWKDISGFEEIYKISSFGMVYKWRKSKALIYFKPQ